MAALERRDRRFVHSWRQASSSPRRRSRASRRSTRSSSTSAMLPAGAPVRLLMHGFTDYFTATSVFAAHQANVTAVLPWVEAQQCRWLVDAHLRRHRLPRRPAAHDDCGPDRQAARRRAAHPHLDEPEDLLGPGARGHDTRGRRAGAAHGDPAGRGVTGLPRLPARADRHADDRSAVRARRGEQVRPVRAASRLLHQVRRGDAASARRRRSVRRLRRRRRGRARVRRRRAAAAARPDGRATTSSTSTGSSRTWTSTRPTRRRSARCPSRACPGIRIPAGVSYPDRNREYQLEWNTREVVGESWPSYRFVRTPTARHNHEGTKARRREGAISVWSRFVRSRDSGCVVATAGLVSGAQAPAQPPTRRAFASASTSCESTRSSPTRTATSSPI